MRKKSPTPGFWARVAMACAVLAVAVVSVYSRLSPEPVAEVPRGLRPDERGAFIHVSEGSGWLSTGEELQIAEWYSGAGQEEYFVNFRGSDGGATVDLRLSGPGRPGAYVCAEAGAAVELRVDVRNAYRSGAGECRLTVTRVEDDVVEGHYQATLTHAADDEDQLTITGNFRATRPQPERLSAARSSPSVAGL